MDTGSISGFSFMITGVPTSSDHSPRCASISEDISIIAVSMFAPEANSITTSDRFSLEVDVMFLMSVSVPNADSSGRVTSLSTFSGVAPT